jgi:hypothetical protein
MVFKSILDAEIESCLAENLGYEIKILDGFYIIQKSSAASNHWGTYIYNTNA